MRHIQSKRGRKKLFWTRQGEWSGPHNRERADYGSRKHPSTCMWNCVFDIAHCYILCEPVATITTGSMLLFPPPMLPKGSCIMKGLRRCLLLASTDQDGLGISLYLMACVNECVTCGTSCLSYLVDHPTFRTRRLDRAIGMLGRTLKISQILAYAQTAAIWWYT